MEKVKPEKNYITGKPKGLLLNDTTKKIIINGAFSKERTVYGILPKYSQLLFFIFLYDKI